MAIDDAINELKAAFDKVAHEIALTHPAAWGRLHEWYGDDAQAKVQMMLKKPNAGFGDKSLLEVADEYGDQAVINYMDAIDAGVYM